MKLLHINASPRQSESRSLSVADKLVSELTLSRTIEADRIDLFQDEMPEFGGMATEAKMALFTGQSQTEAQVKAWSELRAVFDRFAAANLYVFNIPMWNNGIPYKFKQFIDIVTQPGWAFGFDPDRGYSGLMADKKAVVIHTSGVWYEGIRSGFGSDFASPYVTDWLNFIGVTDIEQIRFQPTVLNSDVAATEAKVKENAKKIAAKLAA